LRLNQGGPLATGGRTIPLHMTGDSLLSATYKNVPPDHVDPLRNMFEAALGRAPGLGRMTGRRVLVVGAGQRESAEENPPIGNGRAIARLLGREGAQVVCLDISAAAADRVRRDIEAEGGTAFALAADVQDTSSIGKAVEESAGLMGGLDGLVLSVGISGQNFDEMSLEDWDRVFAINVRSHMWFAKAALPVLDVGSAIALISSRAGMQAGSHMPAYDVSKGAQYQLTRTIALEGEPRAIRCNCVIAGLMDTPMGRDEGRKRPSRAAKVAFGRQGTGWDIAYAVLFMLSRESSYINAQCLVVDGGQFYGVARS
jgi:NAD(P)-dependent dehydrogenase (short-subunit alcohol dehydrogenase family)